ncbi:MAG: polysaccharide deacetylase family protein [Candidatus Shapirobacteria bacterium]|nr:polysaccharide deacetylase family protein [Candidatus Shapirobacteria bacterium]
MNNLEKGRKFVAGGLTTAMILTGLSGCGYVEAKNKQPTITNSVPSPTEIPPTPTLIPTLEPTPTPTLEPTPTTAPSPTEVPLTPTPEKRANPSVIINRGNPNKPEIAFTFDDSGKGLHEILNICNQRGIKSTFFLLSGELKANPDIWRQAVKDGHQICNHTVGHRMDLSKLPEAEIKKEILGWEKVALEVLGEEYLERMKRDFPYFRAPGGHQSERLQQVLGELGYPITAYWSAEDCWTMEPKNNPNNLTLAQNYLIRLKNGAIFLAHGGSAGSVAEVIDGAEEKGYSFKLLSEILD